MRLITLAIILLAGCASPPVEEAEDIQEVQTQTPDPDPEVALREHVQGQGHGIHRRFSFEATQDGFEKVRLQADGAGSWVGEVSIVLIAPDGTEEPLADGLGSEGIYGSAHVSGTFHDPATLPYARGTWIVDVRADGAIDVPLKVELR